MNDGGNPQGLNYDSSKPYVIVYGQKLSKDQWAAIDRYEAGQTAAEFGAGIWDGIKSLPGGVWNGIKTVGDGYRGLAYLLSGNIDSFKPRSNVTLDSIGRGIYHSSPLGIVGSLVEGRYRQAGSDTVGTAVGFATTKYAPELNKVPGLNSDVGAMSKTALRSLGETASTRIENYLNDQGLILYAVPPANQVAINKATGDAWELDYIQNVLPATQVNIQPQITIRSNGPSGLRVRLDALGQDTTSGVTALSDMKASQTALYTKSGHRLPGIGTVWWCGCWKRQGSIYRRDTNPTNRRGHL
jgi:hypothetical protein